MLVCTPITMKMFGDVVAEMFYLCTPAKSLNILLLQTSFS